MIFVSFEDELAIFETVLFPDSFNRFYPLLDDGWAFLIFGRVEDDMGAVAISVEHLVMVSRRTGEPAGAEHEGGVQALAAPALRRARETAGVHVGPLPGMLNDPWSGGSGQPRNVEGILRRKFAGHAASNWRSAAARGAARWASSIATS